VLSQGEAHDVTAYDDLMEQRDSDPGAMLADKGYDSDAIRQDLRDRGTAPEIPTKRNRTVCSTWSTSHSMLCARASSASSAISRSSGVLPPDMTRPQAVSWVLSCSDVVASGSGLSTGPSTTLAE